MQESRSGIPIPPSRRSSSTARSANSACGRNSRQKNSSSSGPFSFFQPAAGTPDPNTFKSVEQAINDYLAEKRGTLDPSKESTKLTIQKIGGIIKPLAPFLKDRGQSATSKKPLTFHGKVEAVSSDGLTVNGEKVEGWMDAMTMKYKVDDPKVLKQVKPGDRITATVYEGDMSLHKVKVDKSSGK